MQERTKMVRTVKSVDFYTGSLVEPSGDCGIFCVDDRDLLNGTTMDRKWNGYCTG